MSSAKISLVGLYQWLYTHGTDMFEAFNLLPEGIDKDTLENLILTEGGEFEPIFANAEIMKEQVALFVNKHNRTFQKWMDALAIEYDPLNNYDRTEVWTEKEKHSDASNGTQNASSQGTTNGSDITQNDISAYDSAEFQPHDKTTGQTTTGSTSSGNTTTSDSSNGSSENERKGRAYGNIGVTTSQQMLQSELDIARFNVYENIKDLFIDELLIAVYV